MEVQLLPAFGQNGLFGRIAIFHKLYLKAGGNLLPFFIYSNEFTSNLMGWSCRLYIFIFVSCFLPIRSHSQSLPVKRYTISDGLLTNEIYQVYQDSKGYIWLATAFGVNRFNGSHFEIVQGNGFRNMSVNEILEDKRHQMWFITFSGKMFFQKKNGCIHPFLYNREISERINTNKGHIKYSFVPFSDSSVMISLKDKGTFFVDKNGILSSLYNQKTNVVFDFRKSSPFISHCLNFYDKDGMDIYLSSGGRLHAELKVAPTHLYALKLSNGKKIISTDEYLYVISGRQYKVFAMDDGVLGFFQDKSGKIWVLLNGKGAWCYQDEDFSKKPLLKLLNGETVTSMIQDYEGAYWFSTLTSGVCYIPSLSIENYTVAEGLPSSKISKVFVKDSVVWVGFLDAFVSSISPKGAVKTYKSHSKYKTYVKWLGYSKDSDAILVSSDQLYEVKDGKSIPMEDKHLLFKGKDEKTSLLPRAVIPSKKGGYWLASNRGIKYIKDKKVCYDSYLTNEFTGVSYSCAEDKKGGLWIASNSLWYYRLGKFINYGLRYPELNVDISKVFYDEKAEVLWIGTKENGLLRYDGHRFIEIGERKGLLSNVIADFEVEGNEVWIGTNKGVNKVVLGKYHDVFSVSGYNSTHGLVGNDIRDLCLTSKFLYVATTSGLSRIDRSKEHSVSSSPKVVISVIKVNDKDTVATSFLHLKHNQNFIDIRFNALTYKRENGRVTYRYKLEGLSEKWFYTEEESARFYKLEPGTYRFLVEAKNSDGLWSKSSAGLEFCIEKPFWSTWWFQGLLLLLLCLVVYGVMRARIVVLRKLSLYERKGNLWKNQSLSLQMNPHFIFNTLNSIQLFILKCDVESSLYYLSKFSILMRKTLENSNKIKISLKEELETLSLYLELEKLRSEGKFTFDISCDEDVNQTDTYIPTLLIQPFVENSIWHGIMPKDGAGHIDVKIVHSGTYIKCCITDDGIGRAKSLELKQNRNTKGHTSFATRIVSRRMQLLKALYKKEFGLKYADLYDSTGAPCGTEVVIIVPRDFRMMKEVNLIAE